MATTSLCPDCDKQEGIVPCLGCKKIFCVKHFQTHRQNLSVELDNVVTRRNTLQEYYYETIVPTFDPTKFGAWNTVDEWEQKMHEQVRQTADEARKQLDAFSKQARNKIEHQLNAITETIQQKMERENFVEEDIEQLTNKIDRIDEGIQNNKYHPPIEVTSEPIDWKTAIQIKLITENGTKPEKQEPIVIPPPSSAVAITTKSDYPRSLQRKCFTCGTDTWQKECKCCSQVYCGWHLKRHAVSSKKH
ncbi:unnamed protein product [Adineta ricciae]|uniref:B box-type domain-containing protein n=1 Tax=Adineta ricciae TaxID=249248 RepID=A0A813SV25_ADIRI|nr:unnamed protein product [Adineta ricciae]CAF1630491.1 unnamed protein product [Adineta ricciae]